MASDEPNLPAGSIAGGGPGFRTGSGGGRRTVAGTLAAKVTVEGVRKLTQEFNGLLTTLKNVRSELGAINKAAGGAGTGGVGQGTPTGAAGTTGAPGVLNLFGGGSNRGPGGFTYGSAAMMGGAALGAATSMVNDRFARNIAQSIPISSRDALTASMYGVPYQGMEMRRFSFSGQFGGSRESQQAAQQIGLRYGTTMAGSERFMQQAGAMVQASGGSINIAQAAQSGGLFASPMVANRARAMGIMTLRQQGEINNPMTVAMDYIKDYEKRAGVTMNTIDFSSLQSPGSGHRLRMKQMYGLSDEAIDMMVQAGMQNAQFRTKTGRGINFSSSKDLGQLGLNSSVLGLSAARFGTTVQRREARFFGDQEGAMTGRLAQENAIQEALAATEDAFSSLLGPMHEFERVIKVVAGGLGLLGGMQMLGGGLGLGGGGGGGGPGGGVNILGRTLGPVAGGMSRSGMLAGAGVAVGSMGVMAGLGMGSRATTLGGVAAAGGVTALGGAAMGAGIGTMLGGPVLGTAIGAGAGAVIGTAFAARNYFKNVDRTKVQAGFDIGVGMTDRQLIESLGDYVENERNRGKSTKQRGEGAGPLQRGRFDAFVRRRGSLLAAALDEAHATGVLKTPSTQEGAELRQLVDFFSSDAVFDDGKLWSNKSKAESFVTKIRSSEVWRKYFGSVSDPFAYQPVNTPESTGLIMTGDQMYGSSTQTGDGAFSLTGDPYRTGDPVSDRAEGTGDTWNKLDNRMKDRLLRLFRGSGGRVWLGGGWRSSAAQEQMFRSRHTVDPNGPISWNGQKWRHTSGAAAAPPGRSMHEIGLAADLEGDLNWVQSNAAAYGLKTFANVNNEPWHVQPTELPNSRREFESSGGTSDSGGGAGAGTPSATTTAAGIMFGGGGGGGSVSGIGYSIAAGAGATVAPGAVSGGGGGVAGATAGAVGGGAGTSIDPSVWGGDTLSRGVAVVKLLKQAGFSGDELTRMAAIAFHESGWNPNSWVEDNDDIGGGLFAINQKPWIDQGLTPKYSKAEIQDPLRSAQIAREYFLDRGYQPWTTRNKPLDMGAQARAAAGVGDGPFDAGFSSAGGGRAAVTINVSINSTGNVRYDAQALGDAVRPVLSNVMAEISTKRGS